MVREVNVRAIDMIDKERAAFATLFPISDGLTEHEMVEFQCEEQPGISVFYKDKTGDIFHTYSSYGRGGDILVGTYNYLDLTPFGRREEKGQGMDWVRHHDRYD